MMTAAKPLTPIFETSKKAIGFFSLQRNFLSTSIADFGTKSAALESDDNPDLYDCSTQLQTQPQPSNVESLLNKKGHVRRTFSPNSNAQALLVCGGDDLASNASFDPQYKRAKNYIQNHAVGHAVLSPILVNGLVGAMIESTFPQGFFVSGTMKQLRPLIVGVEVEATFHVVSVNKCVDGYYQHGYELLLETEVKRVSDGEIITNGSQTIWLPDYGQIAIS
jgi:hypothetical protein